MFRFSSRILLLPELSSLMIDFGLVRMNIWFRRRINLSKT